MKRKKVIDIKLYSNHKLIPIEDINEINKFDIERISDYISDPFTFNIGIASFNSKVIGFGIIRVLNEFKMALDPKLSNFKRAEIISLLMDKAIEQSKCNEIVVSVTKGGINYMDLLKKHFNFYKPDGIFLKLEL